MRILRYAEAVQVVSAPSEYLHKLNINNINIRRADNITELILRRRRSVLDLYAAANIEYRRVLTRLCNSYPQYAKYTRYTGIIMTDGTDECGASHCYDNNIVLAQGMFNGIMHLFPHEIWHIISRQLAPAELGKIYALYNMHPVSFRVPDALANIMVINPDNLDMSYAHKYNGNMYVVFPVMQGTKMFDVDCVAVILNGVPHKLDEPYATHIRAAIMQQCDTDYITGADEVIADNFANFHTGKQTALNTRLVREYIAALVANTNTNTYYV